MNAIGSEALFASATLITIFEPNSMIFSNQGYCPICKTPFSRPLSNNVAENSMRPIALGRKNWLHVGSAKSGPKVAAILSVVESCRRLGVPVKEYLLAVLPGMNQRKLSEVAVLTPARWKSDRA
jgi:hypothetical protein